MPERPRIQYLTTLNSARDVVASGKGGGGFASFILGDSEDEPDVQPIARPYGLKFAQDSLLVCDSANPRLLALDFGKGTYKKLAEHSTKTPLLPVDVTLAGTGEVFVADAMLGRIVVPNAKGEISRTIAPSTRMRPVGTVWRKGELFVSDRQTESVLVFDAATGQQLRTLGRKGSNPGEYRWPTAMAFGPDGNLYVCDTLNARVQKVTPQGQLLKVFGKRGLNYGEMVRPKGVAVDRKGRLYVSDSMTQFVQIFDSDGRLLLFFGGGGTEPGNMSMPVRIELSYDGVKHFTRYASPEFDMEYLIFVGNQSGAAKVNVYGFGEYKGVVPAETPEGKAALEKEVAARKKAAEAAAKAGKPSQPRRPGMEPGSTSKTPKLP